MLGGRGGGVPLPSHREADLSSSLNRPQQDESFTPSASVSPIAEGRGFLFLSEHREKIIIFSQNCKPRQINII